MALDKNLVAVAIDAAQNTLKNNYSQADASETIRGAMIELFGTERIDYKTFRRHKVEIFEFIEETITPVVHTRLEDTFNRFAEFRSIPYGDANRFNVPSNELFRVAAIAEGSGNIRRKRLEGADFDVETQSLAVGMYEELARFLAGRVDWATYIDTLIRSFERDIAVRISNALYGAYDSLSAPYQASVSGGDIKEQVLEVAAHVEAEHGSVVILGTRSALAKLQPEYYSDAQAGRRNEVGYFGVVDGYDVMAIPQYHKSGTNEFGVDNDTLLILPQADEKLVKVVLEGNALVLEVAGDSDAREDLQMQYDVIQRAGVAALTARKFGMVKLT